MVAEIHPLQPSCVLSLTRDFFLLLLQRLYILIYLILFDKMGVNHITCRYLASAFDSLEMSRQEIRSVKKQFLGLCFLALEDG